MSQIDTLDEIIEMLKYGMSNREWNSIEEALEYLEEEKARLIEEMNE